MAPAELEDKLLGHEDVNDACVIGVWDNERHTEVPRAYIVLKPGVQESGELAQSIVDWLGERLSPPKKLRGGVRFVARIPKSQAGKILRRVLKEEATKEPSRPSGKL